MRVLLTGGTGHVGPQTIRHLTATGHEVLVVGRRAGATIEGARYAQCDINDYAEVERLMAGFDAVVHLAAIANPYLAPGREVFHTNAGGSYNVYEAAAAVGIRRVVSASSINALGYFYGRRSFPIRYLPLDEDHPVLATDAYSFSKQVHEAIGRYFWMREGVSGVCLRFPAVVAHDRVDKDGHGRAAQRGYIRRLLAMPARDRTELLRRLHHQYDAYRSQEHKKGPARLSVAAASGLSREELGFMETKANFWARLDDRDAAQAIGRAVTGDYEGFHTLFVNHRQNSMDMNVEDLAALYYPPVEDIREQRNGDSCLVSIDRARELLGFEPQHDV